MYSRTLLFITIFVIIAYANASLLRNQEKPLDKLTDEELGIKNGDLTPKQLTKYKKRVTELKASLDTLMARQTVLNVEYNTLLRQENRDSDLKRKVKGMVARSVQRNIEDFENTIMSFSKLKSQDKVSKITTYVNSIINDIFPYTQDGLINAISQTLHINEKEAETVLNSHRSLYLLSKSSEENANTLLSLTPIDKQSIVLLYNFLSN